MSWPKNHVPKYRKHRASQQAIVTLEGRDYYLGPHGSETSKAEYDRLIAEWLANGRRLPQSASGSVSVEELLGAFWEHAECYYVRPDGSNTKELDAYRQAMKPIRAMYADLSTEDFGPLSLKALRQWFIDQGFARSHINHQIGRIKRIFKWGVENELVSPVVYQGLQAVAGLKKGRSDARETGPVKPAPEGAVDAVKPHVSRQVWAMVELQRLTGMRSGELTIMRGCDLKTGGEVWEYRPTHHKTAYRDLERVIYLGPKAQEIIKPFLKKTLTSYLFSPRDAEADRAEQRRSNRKTSMTPSQKARKPKALPKKAPGDHYTSQSYGQAIATAAKKAKVEHWSPHQLRHSAATRIRRDFGLEAAQVILGHSNADVTQVYAETCTQRAREIAGQCG